MKKRAPMIDPAEVERWRREFSKGAPVPEVLERPDIANQLARTAHVAYSEGRFIEASETVED